MASLKGFYTNFKDNIQELLEVTDFSVISWLALGMSFQLLSQAWLPPNLSYWLPLLCVVYKLTRSIYDCTGLFDRSFSTVKHGAWTTKLPEVEPTALTSTNDGVVMFVLVGRVNHPFGKLSPGTSEIDTIFRDMWKEVEAKREKWSYLGRTQPMLDITDEGLTVLWLSYWKDLEGLRSFAMSAVHRTGQTAYANKKYPYVGIMHETYHAPKGHWETVYHNFPPFGMGTTKPHLSKDLDDLTSAQILRPNQKGSTLYSRMGWAKAPAGREPRQGTNETA